MKLQEWKSMNSKPTVNSASGSYKKRFEKLIKYHIDHASSELESVTTKDIKPYGFHLGEHYNDGHNEFDRDIVASADKNTGILTFSVFVDGKEVCRRECQDYEEFVNELGDSYMYVTTLKGTPDYEDLLVEWIDANGKKINPAASSASTTAQTKKADQTDRYKSLLAQMDNDGTTYKVNDLTDTNLDITVDRPNKPLDIEIIYDAASDTYTIILLGKKLVGCKYKEDILELLVIGKIIKDTNLCESASLSEFIDKNGKKVNINTTSTRAAASTKNYPDHTERYKKLLAQIDSDGFCKYTVNLLDDRILALTLNNGVGVKIIFKPYVPCYLVQVDGYDNNCKDWDEVLKLLIIEGIIGDTDLCESSSYADDFKIYEDMWNS